MYSSLKKLSVIYFALTAISVILSICAGIHLYHILDETISFVYIYACMAFIPIALLGTALALRKIAEELDAESLSVQSRMKELEKSAKN